jgi:Ca-activated chloride channel family protein
MFWRALLLSLSLKLSVPVARACDLALVLAVDISGSVDSKEYRIQMDGLAAALRDGIVVEALLDQQAMITLIQWTGASRQRQTIPWTQMLTDADILRFAERVETDQRIWRNYSTAIGEALIAAEVSLAEVPECRRKVIDVSCDGVSNEGVDPRSRHAALSRLSVTVNALAIETDETDLTAWFFENLIRGPGAFVMTADGFEDYPVQIRRKLQRETTKQLSTVQ